MRDNTKGMILKILLVICVAFMFMVFPGSIVWMRFIPCEDVALQVFNIVLFTTFGLCLLFMLLLPILGRLKPTSVKAEKIPFVCSFDNVFFDMLHERLLQRGYQPQKCVSISSDGQVKIYFKPSKGWKMVCFTIIRVDELSDELIECSNESITKIIQEYFGTKIITASINMMSIFCVNRVTPSFRKLVNSNMQQGLKNGRFLAGISSGGGNLYIATQKDGFAITKYKQLKKEFIDIMGLQNINE